MTAAHLIQSLASELRDATTNLKLPSEYHTEPTAQDFTPVKIFEQYLPLDLFENVEYYPSIVIELIKLSDDLKEGSTATIGLSLGVYAKEADGWLDAFHLMEVVRERLLSRRTIARRFRLTDEVEWTTPSAQPAPFFFITGELTYQLFQPHEVLTKC